MYLGLPGSSPKRHILLGAERKGADVAALDASHPLEQVFVSQHRPGVGRQFGQQMVLHPDQITGPSARVSMMCHNSWASSSAAMSYRPPSDSPAPAAMSGRRPEQIRHSRLSHGRRGGGEAGA